MTDLLLYVCNRDVQYQPVHAVAVACPGTTCKMIAIYGYCLVWHTSGGTLMCGNKHAHQWHETGD